MTADRERAADHGADHVAGVCLVIERTTTTDCAAGLPWPPPGEHWHVVHRAGDRTTWRRISIWERRTTWLSRAAGCASTGGGKRITSMTNPAPTPTEH
jgi:hypothetical protein